MDGEWLEDAFGPDAVRVTFCFTTAVSRYAQALSGIGIAGSILTGESRISRRPIALAQIRSTNARRPWEGSDRIRAGHRSGWLETGLSA